MVDKAQADQVERPDEQDVGLEQTQTFEKADKGDQDVALKILTHIGSIANEVDPEAERRLVRKIDRHVIPLIAITYFVTYIDKSTLSYAALFGLQADVGLVGTQYSWLSSIFYFGYIAFEYFTSFAMQKLPAGKWMAGNIIIWGGICAALGGCNSFGSLAALRFILGMLESCSTPAFLLITAMFYKVEEQPIRIGYWSTFLGLASAIGGLIAFGIGQIQGSLENWRYQFIIVGLISCLWGVILYIFVADNPTNARWLSHEEQKIAVERLRSNQAGIKNTKIKWNQVVEALTDPKTWFSVFFGLSTQVVNGSVSNFGTLIIKGFGYSSLKTTLLQIPYGLIISFAVLSSMYLQRWLPGQKRCVVGIMYVTPALIGVICIHVLPRTNTAALLGCYYLTAFYTASFAICMSLFVSNTAGSTKRSVVNATFFVSYCVGNIIGPFAFISTEAPAYRSGIIAILVAYCVEIAVLVGFGLYLAAQNRIKERKIVENGLQNTSEEEKALAGFRDMTDIENPWFRYSY
ncbi:MFS allantoate transporter [Xylariales sp. PMI_506]|nr:MFS allantoate transporter [Xylariales sp. PMI_506]